MALFGRDALITGYQTMILGPEPAKNALRALARYQAAERDDFRDAEPGKIPHELRVGELAFFGEVPHSPYYGTVDATPLFLILLSEVWRWSADAGFAREMEGAARLALAWILEHADRVDGYVAYASRSPAGLQNHGWRDRASSMVFRDGTRAESPIAPARSKATYTTLASGSPSSPSESGVTATSLVGFGSRRGLLGSASTGTSGWRTAVTTPSPWTVRGAGWILWAPAWDTYCGAASSPGSGLAPSLAG